MRRSLIPALLPVCALLALGCGSSGGGGGDSGAAGAGSGGVPDGKALFAGTCGSCHTLKAAGTDGTFGPNLDQLRPSKQIVLTTIKTGPGAMPAGLFKGAKAEAIADFVSSNAGK
jgi:mono/diheme cytochrome c family protein